jgi:hypothetical protein
VPARNLRYRGELELSAATGPLRIVNEIDIEQYLSRARGRGAGGEPIGVREMLRLFRREAPWLVIGNFSRGLDERGPAPR